MQIMGPKKLTHHKTRIVFATLLFFLITAFLMSGYFWFQLPDVERLKHEFPVVSYSSDSAKPEVKWKKSAPPHWRPLKQISKPAIGAILVSEDWAFYRHEGVDWNQIRDAMESAVKSGHVSRGASTITQQVVKNVFLSQERSIFRKASEFVLARQMEEKLSKNRILETYLNIAEWGRGVVGIQKASDYYFGKDASQLRAKEGAFLAMLLPSPHRYGESYRQKKPTLFARQMMSSILRKMVQGKVITEEEALQEIERPLPFEQVGGYEEESPSVDVEDMAVEKLRPSG